MKCITHARLLYNESQLLRILDGKNQIEGVHAFDECIGKTVLTKFDVIMPDCTKSLVLDDYYKFLVPYTTFCILVGFNLQQFAPTITELSCIRTCSPVRRQNQKSYSCTHTNSPLEYTNRFSWNRTRSCSFAAAQWEACCRKTKFELLWIVVFGRCGGNGRAQSKVSDWPRRKYT